MSFRLVEITELSGTACKIYSVSIDEAEDTLFDYFLDRLSDGYPKAVEEIWNKLLFMGEEGGVRLHFFRENEGHPGDGVVALLDEPRFPLRLYGIRFGTVLLILGDGGYKAPQIHAWQEDETLSRAAKQMIILSAKITERIRDKSIRIDIDGTLKGDLVFEEDTLNTI